MTRLMKCQQHCNNDRAGEVRIYIISKQLSHAERYEDFASHLHVNEHPSSRALSSPPCPSLPFSAGSSQRVSRDALITISFLHVLVTRHVVLVEHDDALAIIWIHYEQEGDFPSGLTPCPARRVRTSARFTVTVGPDGPKRPRPPFDDSRATAVAGKLFPLILSSLSLFFIFQSATSYRTGH